MAPIDISRGDYSCGLSELRRMASKEKCNGKLVNLIGFMLVVFGIFLEITK